MVIDTTSRKGMESSLVHLMGVSVPELYQYIEAAADSAVEGQWCFNQDLFDKAKIIDSCVTNRRLHYLLITLTLSELNGLSSTKSLLFRLASEETSLFFLRYSVGEQPIIFLKQLVK